MKRIVFLALIRLIGLSMLHQVFVSVAVAAWKEHVLYSFQGGNNAQTPVGGVVFDKQGNLYGATITGTVYQLAPPMKKGDAWTEAVLYIFQGKSNNNDGMQPSSGLVIDSSGNLYGTTAYGGTGGCILLGILYGCGTVYELSPPAQKGAAWTETILYSFQSGNDGYFPSGNLTFDQAGNLYGATQFGGGKGNTCDPYYQYCGTVFKMSPPKKKGGTWTEQVLHSFAGSTDGANPNGGLVLDKKGAIFGTTYIGGYNCPHHSGQGCGTVFKLNPPSRKGGRWTEKQLHVFKNGDDGALPGAGVVLDAKGFLFGGAEFGPKGGGVVFRLATTRGQAWRETVVYAFNSNTYAYDPAVSLFDSSGNIYGTTYVGPGSLAGSVFRLAPPGGKGKDWTVSELYGFTGGSDGRFPFASLIFDHSGRIYGATQEGGGKGNCEGYCGMVFEVQP
jgi:hypothetical protein